jgi:hypothetical protein
MAGAQDRRACPVRLPCTRRRSCIRTASFIEPCRQLRAGFRLDAYAAAIIGERSTPAQRPQGGRCGRHGALQRWCRQPSHGAACGPAVPVSATHALVRRGKARQRGLRQRQVSWGLPRALACLQHERPRHAQARPARHPFHRLITPRSADGTAPHSKIVCFPV